MTTIPTAVRTIAATLTGVALTAGLTAIPTTGTSQAYSVGVKSLALTPVADECDPGQDWALPCTAGAGEGEANVLRVVQTPYLDGAEYGFSEVEGTSLVDGRMWLAADFDAACRTGHHLIHARVDGDLSDPAGEFKGDLNAWGGGGDPFAFPRGVSVPNGRTVQARLALNVPISGALANGNVGDFESVQDLLDAGEQRVAQLVDGGMTELAARAQPYELNTWVTVAAEVQCEWDGLIWASYAKRIHVAIPLRIDFVPIAPVTEVDLPPVPSRHEPADELTAAAEVTDAALSVVPDPDDPCTLHLSGTIQTNRPTSVEYRFVDPHGQPSNTYTVDVDATQTAFVSRSVQVPMADTVDIDGELATLEPDTGLDGFVTQADGTDEYTGTYLLEVLSPNHVLAGDGFSVPFCSTPILGSGLERSGDPLVVAGRD